ncbi:MAG: VCBS repeat domain-containing M23 family metallopeptidase [Patescibacteria group bacterium]
MKSKKISIIMLCSTLMFASFGIFAQPHTAHAEVRDIRFPVIGPVSYANDFGAPRTGHTHIGNDIIGTKHQPLVAAVSGTIKYVANPEPYYGYYVEIVAPDGWSYHYLHINNDNLGTDDGRGSEMLAYAPDMKRENTVTAGQLIGWMGDSGNAESTVSHLHFEIHDPEDNAINPFDTLQAAPRLSKPVTDYATQVGEFLPYGTFQGGANIAMGEFSSRYDGEEIVTGAAAGGGPLVKVFTQTGKRLSQFYAFEESVRGGVDVAVADVDGDGIHDIIAAAGENSSPRIRVFDKLGNMKLEFLAFEEWFRGGVRVAAADLNGDGKAEILTAPAKNYAPWLKIYSPEGKHQSEFLTYGIGFKGGFDVSATSKTDTAAAVIATSPALHGGPDIRVFNNLGTLTRHFFAYGEGYRGGVRIDLANVDVTSDAPEIVTAPQTSGGPDFRVYSLKGNLLQSLTEFEKWWRGGYDVAAGEGKIFVSSQGGRRTSVRELH